MARQVRVEVVMDDSSYVAGGANLVSTNTKIQASNDSLAVNSKKVADAQVAAILRVREASKLRIASLSQTIAAGAGAAPGSHEAEAASAASVALQREQAKLARSYGETTVATRGFSTATKQGEKDLSRVTRGVLAGSGVMTRFGRSLAFASGGFLGFAIGASVVAKSISAAEDLTKAQDSLAVAIEHTGGNLRKLEPRYTALAKGAAEFGQSQLDATTGLARATVLTGDAAKAQRAYQEALVISKATGKDFNAVLTATAKGQEGVTTSLRRYGILIKTGESGTAQLTQVMQRFGGQAAANTAVSDKLRASLANAEAVIGQALLPTFDRLATSLSNWLQKMNQTGQLQKDVTKIMSAAGDVFSVLEGVIKGVDKVTGGFVKTLEILAAFKLAKILTGWASSVELLILKWRGVTVAATEAAAAEAAAGTGSFGLIAGRAAAARTAGAAAEAGAVTKVGKFAALATSPEAIAGAAAIIALGYFSRNNTPFTRLGTTTGGQTTGSQFSVLRNDNTKKAYIVSPRGLEALSPGNVITVPGQPVITPELQNFARTRQSVPQPFQVPGFGGQVATGKSAPAKPTGPFGSAQPIQIWKNFQLRISDQIAQAQASLTKGTQDDVAVAKAVVAHIKQTIAKGHLQGAALIQALGQEASALSTIWSAEAAAAQKRAQAAAAAKARIQQQIENSIDPLKLEVALSRAQAFGKPLLPYLKALRAAAEKALASGKLSLTQQKEAYDQITSLNSQIKAARTTTAVTFTAPAKLQLALAKDAALGISPTKDLLKLRAGILKFIRTHKHNIAALTDAYNQLAQVNQELGSSAQSALGLFKQASTRALTAGLGLTDAQRKAERARLSQLGPGRTVPGKGTGAYGYAINPKTGRPLVANMKPIKSAKAKPPPVHPGHLPAAAGHPIDIREDFHFTLKMNEKVVANEVIRYQQRRRRRNPGQRRGPNAGLAGA